MCADGKRRRRKRCIAEGATDGSAPVASVPRAASNESEDDMDSGKTKVCPIPKPGGVVGELLERGLRIGGNKTAESSTNEQSRLRPS